MKDIERLTAMGFVQCGIWGLNGESITCDLLRSSSDRNVLYAFVQDDEVVYIGKTVRMLKERIYGYVRPGPTQSTNIKGNQLILEALRFGKTVSVYALPDNGLLYYGGFHVNLAAGLEDSLVGGLKPAWNKTGI